MKPIEELLQNLARPDVIEFGLVTDRFPSVNVAGRFTPVDEDRPDKERLLEMLSAAGGAHHVSRLGEMPIQWTTRIEGVGVVAVAAIRRGEVVQARFTVARRDPRAGDASANVANAGSAKGGAALPKLSGAGTTAGRPEPPRPASGAGEASGSSSGAVAARRSSAPPSPRASETPSVVGPQRPAPKTASESEAAQAGAVGSALEQVGVPRGVPSSSSTKMLAANDATERASVAPSAVGASGPAGAERSSAAPSAPGRALALPLGGRARASVTPSDDDEPTIDTSLPFAPRSVAPPSRDTQTDLPAARVGSASVAPPRPQGDDFEAMLVAAAEAGATDLHLVPGRPLLLRIAGDLLARTDPVSAARVEQIVADIVPSRLLERLVRAGACDFVVESLAHGRFRVRATQQHSGVKLAVRSIWRGVPTLSALGLPDVAAEAVGRDGVVLVAGPAGHGKTTTVAALVGLLIDATYAKRALHVVTVEDPIEIIHPRPRNGSIVSQREVGSHTASTATGVRAALAEDADVIVVSSLRDAATVQAVIEAAEAGCLVLATVDALAAGAAVEIAATHASMGERAGLARRLGSVVRCALGQRLLPSADRARLHLAVEVVPGQLGAALARRTMDDALSELVQAGSIIVDVARPHAEMPARLDALREASLTRSRPPGAS